MKPEELVLNAFKEKFAPEIYWDGETTLTPFQQTLLQCLAFYADTTNDEDDRFDEKLASEIQEIFIEAGVQPVWDGDNPNPKYFFVEKVIDEDYDDEPVMRCKFEGYQAYMQGKNQMECIYSSGTGDYTWWQQGWQMAKSDYLRKLGINEE